MLDNSRCCLLYCQSYRLHDGASYSVVQNGGWVAFFIPLLGVVMQNGGWVASHHLTKYEALIGQELSIVLEYFIYIYMTYLMKTDL